MISKGLAKLTALISRSFGKQYLPNYFMRAQGSRIEPRRRSLTILARRTTLGLNGLESQGSKGRHEATYGIEPV